MIHLSRRDFIEASLKAVVVSAAAGFIPGFAVREIPGFSQGKKKGFGPLRPDPKGLVDLPEGFDYRIISRAGQRMSDSFFVPAHPDGMAAFPGPEGLTILLRNHEIWPDYPGAKGAFGSDNRLRRRVKRRLMYDWGRDGKVCLGAVTTIVYDTRTQEVRDEFLSLAGTLANCAGGPTPWNTWISCEEDFQTAGFHYAKNHGYAFEVPASVESGLVQPVPLKSMGRFVRESVAFHPKAGVVYQTEDQVDSLFYRFLPDVPGELAKGGRLQALAFRDRPQFDTRNWDQSRIKPGDSFPVDWVDLDNPDSNKNDLRHRGFGKGAALFAGGEGLFFHAPENAAYFDATNGGWRAYGQLWRYTPSPYEGTPDEMKSPAFLELYLEPGDPALLEHPDNLALTPWGDIFICEDGFGDQFLIGLTPGKELYPFARNTLDKSEFTGASFSPDGSTMFINMQGSGRTLAVTGPWNQ